MNTELRNLIEQEAIAFADSKVRRGCAHWIGLSTGFAAAFYSALMQSELLKNVSDAWEDGEKRGHTQGLIDAGDFNGENPYPSKEEYLKQFQP